MNKELNMKLNGIIVGGDSTEKTIRVKCDESISGITMGEKAMLTIGNNYNDQSESCPCKYGTPCHSRCTCANGLYSGGCYCCCSYGSDEQRKAQAKRLSELVIKEQKDNCKKMAGEFEEFYKDNWDGRIDPMDSSFQK
jgi:hypothetical protein